MKKAIETLLPTVLSVAVSVGLVLWLDARRPPVGPPPAPAPEAALVQSLKAAYAADASPKKQEDLEFLTEVCRQASRVANDQRVKTAKVLVEDVLHAATQEEIGDGLRGVRTVVKDYLDKAMQTKTSAVLDDDLRRKYAAEFANVQRALEGVK